MVGTEQRHTHYRTIIKEYESLFDNLKNPIDFFLTVPIKYYIDKYKIHEISPYIMSSDMTLFLGYI